MGWLRRLINTVRPARVADDLEREQAFHLAERADDLERRGMSREEATREARRRFGNRTVQRERTHDLHVVLWLESLLADVRYAVRGLRGSPGFTAVAVLSLALGIGANTAIFSLTDALVLKPLPVRHPERLLAVDMGSPNNNGFTNPLWEQIRDHATGFSGLLAYGDALFDLSRGGETQYARGAWVSGGFFHVLGVPAEAGRLIGHDDDMRGCQGTAALSDGFARRRFGSAQTAVGKVLWLDDKPFTVVGVTAPDFFGIQVGQRVDVYAPVCAVALVTAPRPGRGPILDQRSYWFLNIMGRPTPGLTLRQVQTRLAAAAPAIFKATQPVGWSADETARYLKNTLSATAAATGLSEVRGRYTRALYVLMVVVGAVLLIACANIANLLLARGAARRHEIAIRLAIGVGRTRLARQLLTESLLLALGGALLGALFARWASHLLVGFIGARTSPIWLDLGLDDRVFAFTVGVAVATALLFGLLPAWRASRVDPQRALKTGARGGAGVEGRHRSGKTLVVGQVALSLALVAAAGLLLGTFRKLVTLDPGFESHGVLLARMDFSKVDGGPSALERQHAMLARLRAIPGVTAAGAVFITPVSGMGWSDPLEVPGYTPSGRGDALAFFNQVSPGYFATMHTRLLAGRDIAPTDGPGSTPVAVVNEAMARKFFGGANPVGKTFATRLGDSVSAPIEVVGLVETAKYRSFTEAPHPTVYIPFGQGDGAGPRIAYAVRAAGPPTSLERAVKAAASEMSPAISLTFTTLDHQVAASLARPRLLATLSGFFGTLALLLAVIGLYGTMSYTVTRRRNEIGIRMALGAAAGRVLAMVMGDAGRLILLGAVGGIGLALLTTRYVASFLYDLTPTDPGTLAMATATLVLVALGAAALPAWRAARLDPMSTLRAE